MKIPSTVRTSLAKTGGNYRLLPVTPEATLEKTAAGAGIPLKRLAKVVMLKSGQAYPTAIVRADKEVDLAALTRMFKRTFAKCGPCDLKGLFPNWGCG